jgi:hypothetical protein
MDPVAPQDAPSATKPADLMVRPMSEKQLTQAVVDCARRLGYLVYHTHDSRRSAPGFPDVVLIRGRRMIVCELKVGKNKPTAAQLAWLGAFEDCGVPAYLWREDDWLSGRIEKVLR